MVTIRRIKNKFNGCICRKCINETFHSRLSHKDCRYDLLYPACCPCCDEMRNIVTGLKFSGIMKMLFK